MLKRLILCALCIFPLAACQKNVPADLPQAEFKTQLRQALQEDPDLLLDVLRENDIQMLEIVEQGVKSRQLAKQKLQLEEDLSNPKAPVIETDRPIRGESNAPITIVAYSDFLCPYCSRGANTIETLMERYPGKIRFVFKHFPRGEYSRKLALFFEAIARQDEAKAWEFHDAIFADQLKSDEDRDQAVGELIGSLNLDLAQLEKDLSDAALIEAIQRDEQEAEKWGFEGTPSFLVNGVAIRGAYPIGHFEKVIRLVEERNITAAEAGGNAEEDPLCVECLEKD